jgi:hypothetical protein
VNELIALPLHPKPTKALGESARSGSEELRCQTIVDFLGERSYFRGKKEANRVIEDPERVLLVGVICLSRAHGFFTVSSYLLLDPAPPLFNQGEARLRKLGLLHHTLDLMTTKGPLLQDGVQTVPLGSPIIYQLRRLVKTSSWGRRIPFIPASKHLLFPFL